MKQKPKNPPREGRVDRARNAREGGEKDSPRADAPAERTSGAKRREERTRSAASPARVQKESPRVKNKKHTSTARKDTKRRGRVRDARHLRASPPRTPLRAYAPSPIRSPLPFRVAGAGNRRRRRKSSPASEIITGVKPLSSRPTPREAPRTKPRPLRSRFRPKVPWVRSLPPSSRRRRASTTRPRARIVLPR